MYFICFALVCVILYITSIIVKLSYGLCKCSRHLVGKVVIVTGSNSGIGFETAKDFAERGARVILACRDEERGIQAKNNIIEATGNKDIHYYKIDLSSFKSIRDFVDKFKTNEKRLDILVNNAGDGSLDAIKTEDGLLLGMQVNYFGPFLLTKLLLPILKSSAPSRIVNVASGAHKFVKLDIQNLNSGSDSHLSHFKTYSKAKLCTVLMTVELSRQLEGSGVTVNSLCPGFVDTNILQKNKSSIIRTMLKVGVNWFGKSAWEGAQTQIYLSVSPEVEDLSGLFFRDCKIYELSPDAKDAGVAKKLWEVTEELVK